jgi:hypothetical protein
MMLALPGSVAWKLNSEIGILKVAVLVGFVLGLSWVYLKPRDRVFNGYK